jgi:hypothetical protein
VCPLRHLLENMPSACHEFQHMLQNRWDDVVTHQLVRCEVCGEVVHSVLLKESLDAKVRDLTEPLCLRHKLERQAGILTGRQRPADEVAS